MSIDGYFGGSKPALYLNYPHLVFIAGGTGIAALLPLIKNYVDHSPGRGDGRVDLVWSVRTVDDIHAFAWFISQLDQDPRLSKVHMMIYVSRGGKDITEGIRWCQEEPPPRMPLDEEVMKDLSANDNDIETPLLSTFPPLQEEENLFLTAPAAADGRPWIIPPPIKQNLHPYALAKVTLAMVTGISLLVCFVAYKKLVTVEHLDGGHCDSPDTYLHWKLYVPCKFWFYSSPMLIPVIAVLVLGGAFTYAIWPSVSHRIYKITSSYLLPSSSSSFGSPSSPIHNIVEDLPGLLEKRVECYHHRADFATILSSMVSLSPSSSAQSLAVLVAGPQAMVQGVTKSAMTHGGKVHVYEESYLP